MAIPVYLWLKNDGGVDIEGSVTVEGREGSIEVIAHDHSVYIATDDNTGKLTGTRTHAPYVFTKEIDASSTSAKVTRPTPAGANTRRPACRGRPPYLGPP